MSYSYTLHKLCQIIGGEALQHQHSFQLLKSRDKLFQMGKYFLVMHAFALMPAHPDICRCMQMQYGRRSVVIVAGHSMLQCEDTAPHEDT